MISGARTAPWMTRPINPMCINALSVGNKARIVPPTGLGRRQRFSGRCERTAGEHPFSSVGPRQLGLSCRSFDHHEHAQSG